MSIRLEEAESGDYLDVKLDAPTVEGYLKRLNNLRADLDRRARTRGGVFVPLIDTESHDEMIGRLLRGGVVGV